MKARQHPPNARHVPYCQMGLSLLVGFICWCLCPDTMQGPGPNKGPLKRHGVSSHMFFDTAFHARARILRITKDMNYRWTQLFVVCPCRMAQQGLVGSSWQYSRIVKTRREGTALAEGSDLALKRFSAIWGLRPRFEDLVVPCFVSF